MAVCDNCGFQTGIQQGLSSLPVGPRPPVDWIGAYVVGDGGISRAPVTFCSWKCTATYAASQYKVKLP